MNWLIWNPKDALYRMTGLSCLAARESTHLLTSRCCLQGVVARSFSIHLDNGDTSSSILSLNDTFFVSAPLFIIWLVKHLTFLPILPLSFPNGSLIKNLGLGLNLSSSYASFCFGLKVGVGVGIVWFKLCLNWARKLLDRARLFVVNEFGTIIRCFTSNGRLIILGSVLSLSIVLLGLNNSF